jgi:hypothetical protein
VTNPGPAIVFVSCGQNADGGERRIAEAIAEKLRVAGFDPYVAVQVQSLSGLKETIFARLSSSDYFLFIDFRREKLELGPDAKLFRGSLFSNQELAIASYLGIPVLAFQEQGVKELDGILQALHANCIPFTKRETLCDDVAREIRTRGWRPDRRNVLFLDAGERSRPLSFGGTGRLARWYPVVVSNRHWDKTARNCNAYLWKYASCSSGKTYRPKTVELKWKGYTFPSVSIASGTSRAFDGFHVFDDQPNMLHFDFFTDSAEYRRRIQGPGEFVLQFTVLSDNFPAATAGFVVSTGDRWDQVSFARKDS